MPAAFHEGGDDGLDPSPRLKLLDWAEKTIMLPRSVSAIPGPYKPVAYQKGFTDALDDASIETIVLMTSSQVGKSEFLVTTALYYVMADPSRILFILPKDDAAYEFKDERVRPILDASPKLREHLKGYLGMRGHDSEGYLDFPGGFIAFAGAGSPTNLAGRPIRILLMDEVDRYEGNVGGEGDPVTLAFKRTTTERTRKIILASTPKDIARSRIDRLYSQTDRRKFMVKCLECEEEQELVFNEERTNIAHVKDRGVCYFCSLCGVPWDQAQVKDAVSNGRWKATAVSVREGWVGFHISELYSPFSSLAKILGQWESAKGDALEEQGFTNTTLGLPWEGKLFSRKSPRTLLSRLEPINSGSLPGGIGCVTAGVDVQGDRVEIGMMGWGIDGERWFLGIERLYGDVNGHSLWRRVTEVLQKQFGHESGATLRIEAVCIDAGFATKTVVDYVSQARAQRLNYFAILGRAGEGRPFWQMARTEQPGKLYAVGVDSGKADLYLALGKDNPGPGYVHLADVLDEGMIEQLVSEECKETVNTRGMTERKWELPKRKRNEALDLAVYAAAAFASLGIDIGTRLEMLWGPDIPPVDVRAIAKTFHPTPREA